MYPCHLDVATRPIFVTSQGFVFPSLSADFQATRGVVYSHTGSCFYSQSNAMPRISGSPAPHNSQTLSEAAAADATQVPPPNIRETPVNLPQLARRARRAVCLPHLCKQGLAQPRLALRQGANALMERDAVTPRHAYTDYGHAARAAMGVFASLAQGVTRKEFLHGELTQNDENKAPAEKLQDPAERLRRDQDPELLKDDPLRLMLLAGLRHMLVRGQQLGAEPAAPLIVSRDVKNGAKGGCVTPHLFGKNTVDHMAINTSNDRHTVLVIAHEVVHEKQFSHKSKRNLNTKNYSINSSVTQARKNFFAATRNSVNPLFFALFSSRNQYLTQPAEVVAYAEQAAFEQHHFKRNSPDAWWQEPPMEFGDDDDLKQLTCLLRYISIKIVDDVNPSAGDNVFGENDCMAYRSNFSEKHFAAFDQVIHILGCLSDIDIFQKSEVGELVARVVHDALKNLQAMSFEEAQPEKALECISTVLDRVIYNMKSEHGMRLHIPADASAEIADFEEAHQAPMGEAKLVANRGYIFDQTVRDNSDLELKHEHIEAALTNSGFSGVFSHLRQALIAGAKIKNIMLMAPVLQLANYLINDDHIKIVPIAVNVYEASSPYISAVEGLSTLGHHRKIWFDAASWQCHIPKYLLQDIDRLAGRLAKMAVDIAQATVNTRGHKCMNKTEADQDNNDFGFALESIQRQSVHKDHHHQARKATLLARVDNHTEDQAQALLNGLISKSGQAYQFKRSGTDSNEFKGPSKPSAENHWHNYGARAMLKRVKDDPTQTPETREQAATAYRAGVLARKRAEPLLAVRRAFALQANALCAQRVVEG
jgi:hypothetical protein